MKRYLKKPMISLQKETYLSLLIVLAPLLNFLGGINIDIYSPSMPAIAEFFNASISATKNTISIMLAGITIGALVFGALMDSFGRKNSLILGMVAYAIASFAATLCHSIHQLMLVRFIQGFFVSTITIGCRTLVIDNFTGVRYSTAILYTSIAYGLGPIIGPFIGGLLQHYIGWEANFIALMVISIVLLVLLVVFVEESLKTPKHFTFKKICKRYWKAVSHGTFIAGIAFLGLIQLSCMLYPTLGPFIVENILKRSVLTYSYSALIIGAAYFSGALTNRYLLKHMSVRAICKLGLIITTIALLLITGFSAWLSLSLMTLIIPIFLFCYGAGFIFSNIMGTNLQLFPDNAGVAMAVQVALLILGSALGIYLVSQIRITGLSELAWIYGVILLCQWLLFWPYHRLLSK